VPIIPPLAAAYAQSSQVQRALNDDKDRQLRRAEALRRNSATASDRPEHEVESSDAVILQTNEDERKNGRKKRDRSRKPSAPLTDEADGTDSIDVVA
jgi:hypothetical protein